MRSSDLTRSHARSNQIALPDNAPSSTVSMRARDAGYIGEAYHTPSLFPPVQACMIATVHMRTTRTVRLTHEVIELALSRTCSQCPREPRITSIECEQSEIEIGQPPTHNWIVSPPIQRVGVYPMCHLRQQHTAVSLSRRVAEAHLMQTCNKHAHACNVHA